MVASYEASSALAKQIEAGAPADVFISADLAWMDYASEHKLIKPDTRFNLLGNRLVLIAPKDSKLDHVVIAKGFDIAKLAGDGRIAVADVKAVPAGRYAKAALTSLGAWAAAEPKLAQAENVRATLAFVARNETPLGIVYATDAKIEPKVKIVGEFPDDAYPPVTYPVAETAASKNAAARALSRLPAHKRGQGGLREVRLQLPDQAGVVDAMIAMLSSPQDWTAVALSLRIATVATLVSLPFGIAIATLLARRNFWGKTLVDAVIYLPLVLPPVVTGYLLLITLGRHAPVGAFLADHFGIVFAFRWTGAVISCGVMAFPLMVRAIRLSIEAIDRRLEDAAATLGAGPFWNFATVTLPLALPGIIAGAMLAFARALGEFGATITFVSNIPGETQTISAAIYTLTQVPGGDSAALSLVVVAVVISLAALVASEWLARRATARLHGA